MSEPSLEPFAAEIDWRLDQPAPVSAWEQLFARYFERLAALSAAHADTLIGHIKGFARLPSAGFIQISAVSAAQPVSVMVQGEQSQSYDRLSLALNLLVYGLPFQEAQRFAAQAAEDIFAGGGGVVHFRVISDPLHTSHHHG